METITLGVVTGVATAFVLGIIAALWRRYRNWRVQQLGDIMAEIIRHRNTGRSLVPDPAEWVRRARELEAEAETRAGRVSSASQRLVRSLGEFKQFPVDPNVTDDDQRHWVSELTAVIARIRDTLGRHDL